MMGNKTGAALDGRKADKIKHHTINCEMEGDNGHLEVGEFEETESHRRWGN